MKTKHLVPIGVVAALTIVVSACGGSNGNGDDVASLFDTDSPATTTQGTGDADTEEATDQSPEEAAIDFAACMREEGVDMPDPEFDEDGGVMFERGVEAEGDGPSLPDRQAMEDAFDACGHIIENAGIGPDGDGPDRAAMEDEVLEFTQCMRDEGVEMADPDFDSPDDGFDAPPAASGPGPVIAGPFGTLDLGDPDVAAAFEECQDIVGMPDVAPAPAEGDE